MHRAQRTATEIRDTSRPIDAGGLMGVLAHELRTPMTTIFAGSAVLAHDERLVPTVRRELAADIYAEASRLFRAVEDLLVLTRLEYDALELTREPVSMSRVIDSVIAAEGPRWPRLSVTVAAPGSLPLVQADSTAVGHALRNLVANIGWRARTVTILEIRTALGAIGHVTCVLSDATGTLEAEDLADLFDLPNREDRSARITTGIGMFVAARLIEAMGGVLRTSLRDDGVVAIEFDLPVFPVSNGLHA